MAIRVEFYGVARRQAGCASLDVEAATLHDALMQVIERLPECAALCNDDGSLAEGYLANINGKEFTRDPQTPLKPGDALLILSADSGG